MEKTLAEKRIKVFDKIELKSELKPGQRAFIRVWSGNHWQDLKISKVVHCVTFADTARRIETLNSVYMVPKSAYPDF